MDTTAGSIQTGGGQGEGRDGSRCATAEELARIAARLFAEKGYDATPVRCIAEAAGVTCPTLYYHFGSKEGLAQALITCPLGRLVSRMSEVLDQAMDPVERLERMVEIHLGFSREDQDRARLVYAVMFGPLGGGLSQEAHAFVTRLTALLSRAVGHLVDAGIVRADRVSDVVMSLRGQFIVRSVEYLYRGGELGPDLAPRLVREVLLGHAEPGAREVIRSRGAREAMDRAGSTEGSP